MRARSIMVLVVISSVGMWVVRMRRHSCSRGSAFTYEPSAINAKARACKNSAALRSATSAAVCS